MGNGIKTKLNLFEKGEIIIEDLIKYLFLYKNNEYFKSIKGNNHLKQIFDSNINNELRCVLIYLILNYSDLEKSWHDKLAKFSFDNIDLLNDVHLLPSSVKNNNLIIYYYLTQRLLNPNYIKSKKWIYILSLPYGNNRKIVKRIIEDKSKEIYPFSIFLPYPISKQVALTLIKENKI